MKSKCCNADTIEGGILNGVQIVVCTKCKKPIKSKWSTSDRDLLSYKNVATDLTKKVKQLTANLETKVREVRLLNEYVKKLEIKLKELSNDK